jgi:hypothetical protein
MRVTVVGVTGDALDALAMKVVDVRVVEVVRVTGACVTRKQLITRLIRAAAAAVVETFGVAAMVKEGDSNETIIAC